MKPIMLILSGAALLFPIQSLKAESDDNGFVEVVKKPSKARKLGQVINRLTNIYAGVEENLRPMDKEHISRLIRRGDFHGAIESICMKLADYQIAIPRDLHAQIKDLAALMEIDPSLIEAIRTTDEELFDDSNR